MKSYWRERAGPIIAEMLRKTSDPKERRRLLQDAYPFGEKKYHPYKIWLDEISRQTGTRNSRKHPTDPNQQSIF